MCLQTLKMGKGFFVLCVFLLPSYVGSQQLRIINQPMVSNNLYEQEGTEFLLQCVTCTGGAPPYAISRVNVAPAFDTCSRCFEVYDNINGRPPDDFCLYYLPSEGTLSYQRQPTYNVSVVCLDSNNNITEPAIIDVRVRTNEPPFFNTVGSFRGTCTISAQTMGAGDPIIPTPWNPFDPDNDPVTYTMTTDPPTDFFQIDPASGTIRATRDLRGFCHRAVSFSINAVDTDGNQIGPYVATCAVPDAYQPPTISNVNKDISLPEDTALDTVLALPYLRTQPLNPFVTYDIETFPPSELSKFAIENQGGVQTLMLKQGLNFESFGATNINITIRPQNGFCEAVEHFINLRVTDANDVPRLFPKNVSRTVNEGGIVINPEWLLIEEDFGDIDVFSIIGGNEDGFWRIDQSTGFIFSSSAIDIDSNVRERNWTLLVQVQDPDETTDNATITIVVEDINDNAPVFTQAVYSFTVLECGIPQNLGVVLSATDADSDFRGNNRINFQPVENEFIKIFTDGTAIIKAIPPVGTSSEVSTFAVDQGEVPNPLTSRESGSVIVTTVPCTTTVAPTVVVVTNTNTNTNNGNSNANASATAVAVSFAGLTSLITSGTNALGSGVGEIFLWVLAGLLGLLFLALLAYLIFRYCARFCTGSSSWADGCGCNRASTPRHIRPFSQDRGVSRQKEDFKPAKKEVEEEEEEEEVVQTQAPAVVYGNSIVPTAKTQRFLRVRRLVPVKPQHVKVKSIVPVPPTQTKSIVPVPPTQTFPNGTYRPAPTGAPPPGPPSNLASYQPAPTGPPTGQNSKPVQGGVNSTFR